MSGDPTWSGWAWPALRWMPVVGFVVASTLFCALLVGGGEAWQLAVLGVVLAALVGAGIRLSVLRRPPPVAVSTVFLVVMVLQGLTASAIGGALTFGFVIIVPVVMLSALLLPRRGRLYVLALAVSVICAIAAAQLAGFDLLPEALDPRAGNATLLIVVNTVVSLIALSMGAHLGQLAQSSRMEAVDRVLVAQAELSEMLTERNRQLVGLTGSIAHELKNPLAAIQGLSKLMEGQRGIDEKQARRLRVLVEESERMGRILEEFLNFSRPISPLTVGKATAKKMLDEVAAIHEGLARSAGVTLTVSAADGTLMCDARKIKQVLVNLVQNALDEAPAGTAVDMAARFEGTQVVFTVVDSGAGLSPEVLGREFTAGVTSKREGAGLGLAISKSIADQHGGALSLTNADAGGCIAQLTLPIGAELGAGTDPA